MALKVGELYGELGLDRKPFDKGLDDSESKAKGWAGRVGGILSGAAGFLAKWGTVVGGAAAAGGFVVANMASDYEEASNKVKVVFGQQGAAMNAWAGQAAQAMGMSATQALSATGTIGNLFVSMGLGQRDAAGMSMSMVKLAGDLASFNNMDPTEVLEKLRSGLVGETEPLRALGVNISAAATEAKAMELGLGAVGRELTAAEKAQANYAIIMEQTTTAQGDFARTSDGMANQQRILTATLADLGVKLGEAFMPIMVAILPGLIAALTGFGEWVTANMPTIQAVVQTVFSVIGSVISVIFTEVLPRLIEGFNWLSTNVIPVLVGAFQQGKGAVDVLGGVFEWLRVNILPPVRQVIDAIATQVIPGLQKAFAGVSDWMTANWPTISSVVSQVAGAISNAASIIAHVLSTLVIPLVMKVAEVVFPALGFIAGILFQQLDSTFKGIGKVFQFFEDVATNVYTAIEGVWKGMAGFFRGVWDTLEGAFKGGANFVIGIVNKLIGFLNGIKVPIPRITIPGTDIGIGGGSFDPFNIGYLPRLARGGLASTAGLAVVGESGPELIYMPKGAQVFSNEDSRRYGGGGNTFHVYGVQPDDVEREVMRAERRLALEWGLR